MSGFLGACLERAWRAAEMLAGRSIYLLLLPVMGLGVALHFRRVRTLHRERLPRSGPVLVVANHPSTWTDVLLLDVVLRRAFHFLANEDQFRPWPRRALLHVYGALPVASLEQRPDAIERNEATFRRCIALFDRGDCVAVFPEGASRVDRGLLPLKPGAARLACFHASARRGPRPLAIVPVGIHYADRTRFRSDVTVSVGESMAASECEGAIPADREEAVRRMTRRVEASLRDLVLEFDDERDGRLVAAIEPLVSPGSPLDLPSAKRMSRSLAGWRRRDPAAFTRFEARVRALERMRLALGVSPQALRPRSHVERWGAIAITLAGALPAAAGAALHAVPAALTRWGTLRYANEPSRVAFARIASGFFFFLTATAGMLALLAALRVPLPWLIAYPVLSAALGVVTTAYTRHMRIEAGRLRLTWLSRRHSSLVGRARTEQARIHDRARELLS